MKTILTAFVLLTLSLTSTPAQEALEPPPGPAPEFGEPELGPPPAIEPPRADQPGTPFVDRWLERMKEKNPEEYGKLQIIFDLF